jgi:glycosyltransferase involved in cell wall biosynthesis
MVPSISVVICTWNRGRLLRGALESLWQATPPRQSAWEVIVVLNNCTDDSAAVVQEFQDRLSIRWVHEPAPGLSFARNRGIDAAIGDFIVWTDDDVRVDARWLVAYENAFRDSPEAAVFGGPIEAEFEGSVPAWLAPALHTVESAFAVKRAPAEGGPILAHTNDFPFGANFALRADVQRRNRYDVRLGRRQGGPIIGGEEYELIRGVLTSGDKGRWVPDAKVSHIMTPERQSPRYLYRYFEGHGRVLGALQPDSSWSAARRDLVGAVKLEARYLSLRLARDSSAWVPALRDAAIAKGILVGRKRRQPYSAA